jgi:hypothetical protein
VDAVVGALCGFLLILLVFADMHGLIEALSPDAYRTAGPPFAGRSDAMVLATFQYFGTITLTTVGFGDIVAVTPAARLVTGLEAMVGQLYLAVVIATLVGRSPPGERDVACPTSLDPKRTNVGAERVLRAGAVPGGQGG